MSSRSGLTLLNVKQFCSSFRTDYRQCHIDLLMDHLRFCIVHCRRASEVKDILRVLPWLSTTAAGVYPTDAYRGRVLLLMVQYANTCSNHSEASWHLSSFHALFESNMDPEHQDLIILEQALTIAGMDGKSGQDAAREAF